MSHVPIVFSQGDLLAENDSRKTVSCDGLQVTRIQEFANFEFLNEYFRSDHFSVMLIIKGSMSASVNFQAYAFNNNSLVVTAPSSIKQILNASPGFEGIVVTFTANFLALAGVNKRASDLLTYFSSNGNPSWELSPEDASNMLSVMDHLFWRCGAFDVHRYGKEQLHHTFAIFLYEVASNNIKYGQPLIDKLTRKEDLVIRFADLVSKHVREQRKVQFYADCLNVTAKYLTETVKEISGKSAGQVIDDFVIVECKLLLENQDHSIAQIASVLNFANPSFFGKYFKRLTGLSPKEFRTDLFR
ncbi:helix-turn-helix domain-containing protein [Ohtaekwangia sp.]|uniref:helix-turn-helix domain-containing protein n=1 Tax=Ohtaekwangia sp. TaxID=2066019 RepID=UPI002FDEF9D2